MRCRADEEQALAMLEYLEPFSQLEDADSDLANVQKMVRRELHQHMNYWDYLIERLAERPADLAALRRSTKQDIAMLFRNQFL